MSHLYKLPSGDVVNLDPKVIAQVYLLRYTKDDQRKTKAVIEYLGTTDKAHFYNTEDVKVLRAWTKALPDVPTLIPVKSNLGPDFDVNDPAWLKESKT